MGFAPYPSPRCNGICSIVHGTPLLSIVMVCFLLSLNSKYDFLQKRISRGSGGGARVTLHLFAYAPERN